MFDDDWLLKKGECSEDDDDGNHVETKSVVNTKEEERNEETYEIEEESKDIVVMSDKKLSKMSERDLNFTEAKRDWLMDQS